MVKKWFLPLSVILPLSVLTMTLCDDLCIAAHYNRAGSLRPGFMLHILLYYDVCMYNCSL